MKTFKEFVVECNDLQEKSLSRIVSKIEKGGVAIVSSDRSDKTNKEKQQRSDRLVKRIRGAGLPGPTQTKGAYRETGTTEDQTEKSFVVHVALPGIKKEEIAIEIEKSVLSISGERKMKNENKEDKFHMVENFYGKFSRSFTLPENVDASKIAASYTDGILLVEIPKAEVKQNKTNVVIN